MLKYALAFMFGPAIILAVILLWTVLMAFVVMLAAIVWDLMPSWIWYLMAYLCSGIASIMIYHVLFVNAGVSVVIEDPTIQRPKPHKRTFQIRGVKHTAELKDDLQ